MIGRFPILYIAEADAEDAVLSSGVLAHLVDSLPEAGVPGEGDGREVRVQAPVDPDSALSSLPYRPLLPPPSQALLEPTLSLQ